MSGGAKNFKGKGKATQFPHNDPTKGGRKPRLFQQMKNKGYSKEDVRACYAALADCTIKELKEIAAKPDATALEITIAEAYLKSAKKGDYRLIKDIIETFADKPKQRVDHASEDGSMSPLALSEEKMADLARRWLEKDE